MTATSYPDFEKSTQATTVAAAFPESIKGRTILITGVNKQGIGYGTAQAFASQSPKCLILAGRSSQKIKDCVDSLRVEYPNVNVRALSVDLSSQKIIKQAAQELISWPDVPSIDLLINNAGVMRHGTSGEVQLTEDGIEDQFGTNHIGHFLFTNLIVSKIIAAAKTSPAGAVRIINISSSGTWVSPFRASDIEWKKAASEIPQNEHPNFAMCKQAGLDIDASMAYIPTAAYGASKTCNVLFSVALNERLFEKYGILSLAVNPGEVKSELGRNTDPEWLAQAIKRREEMGILFWKTLDQGASTTLVAACDPKLTKPGDDGAGYFLDNCQIGKAPPYAVDKEVAAKLWKISGELTGHEF